MPTCALTQIRRLAGAGTRSIRGCLARWTRPITGSVVLRTAADLVRSRPELLAENA